MNDRLIEEVLFVCEILSRHKVDCLIVGGTAVAFHGHYRMSRVENDLPADKHDFDFWYNPTYSNYFNLLKALEELGIDVAEFKNEKVPNPRKSFFTHEFEDFTIDFLPEIAGLGHFNESFSNKVTSVVTGIEFHILSKADLVKSKEATARKKDQDDLNELRGLP